jgi:hypothetical protein
VRRLSAACLLAAWLFASGVALDVAQALAWTRMFVGYARSESVASAARDTFDPQRPCPICRAVRRAREAQGRNSPALSPTVSDKLVLVLESPAPFVAQDSGRDWPAWTPAETKARFADVPVPPPRGAA